MKPLQREFYFGRVSSWLTAMSLNPNIAEPIKKAVTEVLDRLASDTGDAESNFGAAISWLEVLSGNLPNEDKAKVNRLLNEIKGLSNV